ncbi:MAG TPA: hypothetical protein VF054_05630 [Micromonosporaceae bacterium]
MTEHVDLDLLADHAAGLLHDAAAADVERLIREQPEWARMSAAVRAANPTVEARLRDLGEETEPMPADVAARLDAALLALGTDHAAFNGANSDRDEPVVPITDAPSRRAARLPGGGRARSRRRSIAGWASAAAAAAALIVGGLALGGELTGGTVAPSAQSGRHAQSSATAATGDLGSKAPLYDPAAVYTTGRDYSRQDVVDAAALAGGRHLGARAVPQVPDELRRLRDPAALDGCLRAVVRMHGGAVGAVDYARFEGAPALVVVLRNAGGAGTRIVVAGPDCGQPRAGADERYTLTA